MFQLKQLKIIRIKELFKNQADSVKNESAFLKAIDREIKGIRIVEELDIKKYMVGGELLLTSLKVFEKMSEEMFDFSSRRVE